MSKKLFNKLIKRASQPVPKEQDKQLHPEGYTGKKTRPGSAEGTSAKLSGKSRRSNAVVCAVVFVIVLPVVATK